MKRTPLRRVSKKRAKENRQYSVLSDEYLLENPLCEAGIVLMVNGIESNCKRCASEIHHKAKRGKNLNNVETWIPVCRPCHNWIENNKRIARELGLLEYIQDI
jgi:5-methylcytosine-specific restriction endonuclease McrA